MLPRTAPKEPETTLWIVEYAADVKVCKNCFTPVYMTEFICLCRADWAVHFNSAILRIFFLNLQKLDR